MIIANADLNRNLKTSIRYGIISANDIDSDFLAEFEPVYADIYCSNCGAVLSDIYCSECETKNPDYEYPEASYYKYDRNGIQAEFNPDSNIVTVFKSRSIFKRALCSPCYPNAGDLSTPGNYRTYGIPKKYLRIIS